MVPARAMVCLFQKPSADNWQFRGFVVQFTLTSNRPRKYGFKSTNPCSRNLPDPSEMLLRKRGVAYRTNDIIILRTHSSSIRRASLVVVGSPIHVLRGSLHAKEGGIHRNQVNGLDGHVCQQGSYRFVGEYNKLCCARVKILQSHNLAVKWIWAAKRLFTCHD